MFLFYFKKIKYWNVTDAEALRGRSKRGAGDPIKFEYQYSTDSFYGTLRNLTAQVEFFAQVAALNSGGITEEESEMVSFKTEARVPSTPVNVQLTVYGDSAHINWQPPIYPNGYIETYDITIIGTDPRLTTPVQKTIRKDRRSREAYLMGMFEPYTYYDVQVSARNRKGAGEPWVRILFTVSDKDSKWFVFGGKKEENFLNGIVSLGRSLER